MNDSQISAELDRTIPDPDADWQVGPDGDFILKVAAKNSGQSPQILKSCVGNVNNRQIEEVKFKNAIKRPPPGESWSY